jgi:GNAT superfamily N-acetyltransferase
VPPPADRRSDVSDGSGVRPGHAGDAEALARLHLDCWREAYAGTGLVDDERLAPYLADVEGAVRRWHQILDGPARVRLAVADGTPVGLATVQPAAGKDLTHLRALYVRRSHWGTGVGQRLLDEALGDEPATLRVFRDNLRARRFYVRNRFVPDGHEGEEPHLGGIEIGMVRPAAAPASRTGSR